MEKLDQDFELIKKQEKIYWSELNNLESDIQEHQEQMESLHLQFELARYRLDELSKTNVYNDAFKIWHEGPFGTINGLRLGRLPSIMVEWTEINAGLGQTALLLDAIAHKTGFVFDYTIVPLGSWSRIEKRDGDRAVYDLYYLCTKSI
jgi:beclin 1